MRIALTIEPAEDMSLGILRNVANTFGFDLAPKFYPVDVPPII